MTIIDAITIKFKSFIKTRTLNARVSYDGRKKILDLGMPALSPTELQEIQSFIKDNCPGVGITESELNPIFKGFFPREKQKKKKIQMKLL